MHIATPLTNSDDEYPNGEGDDVQRGPVVHADDAGPDVRPGRAFLLIFPPRNMGIPPERRLGPPVATRQQTEAEEGGAQRFLPDTTVHAAVAAFGDAAACDTSTPHHREEAEQAFASRSRSARRGGADIAELPMTARVRSRERPEQVLTVLLRRCYTTGYVQLRQLWRDHRCLQQWPLGQLEEAVRESRYAGDYRFEYASHSTGDHRFETHVALSPHLRYNRHGR